MTTRQVARIDVVTKIEIIISYLIKISLVMAISQEIFLGRWSLLFISALALILTFLPAIIQKNYKIVLPVEFDLIITLFVYASLILGEKQKFYERFAWWDIFLHGQSGLLLGLTGFLIVYVLYSHKHVKISPVFVAIFSFSFAVAIGTVWEIYEFFMDGNFGFNMQLRETGLVDTMWDLITDCGGAFVAALGGYFYVKGGDSLFFKALLTRFFEKNPKLSK